MLEVKNIHKKFGSNEVLKGVDFKVEKGSVIADHAAFWTRPAGKLTYHCQNVFAHSQNC